MGARHLDHPVHVDVIRVALANQASRRMSQDGDKGMGEGPLDPSRLHLPVQMEGAVDARDHQVGLSQHMVGQVEGSVAKDVDLDALEDADAEPLRIQAVDLRDLSPQSCGIETAGDGQSARVVGDGDVF